MVGIDHSIQPWVEKYRPKVITEVAHQDEVVAALKQGVESGNLPHLLLYGPPGTGKTSSILAVAHQLYGPELYRDRVLELNASDERGIAVVRNKVKTFAQHAVGSQRTPGYPCPPYKLVILDEADAMTADAQSALRRTMETYSKVTRFCLICNYISRIITPLTSRCAKFRFKPLAHDAIVERLRFIAEKENVQLTDGGVEDLVDVSGGDMRQAISLLQSASRVYKEISRKAVFEIAGTVEDSVMSKFLEGIRSNSFETMQEVVTDMCDNGYPASQIFSKLHGKVVADGELSETQKAKSCIALACADKRLADGADEFLQLLDVGAKLMRVFADQPVEISL